MKIMIGKEKKLLNAKICKWVEPEDKAASSSMADWTEVASFPFYCHSELSNGCASPLLVNLTCKLI